MTTIQIQVNGIKPNKSEILKLAAKLMFLEKAESFIDAIIGAFEMYDYYNIKNGFSDYYWFYNKCYECYYSISHNYRDYSREEKVLALLFLAEMCEEES